MKTIKYRLKWALAALALGMGSLQLTGCAKANGDPQDDGNGAPRAGYLTGVAKDQAGTPLAGVRILVDHSIFFNSNLSTYTNAEGKYSIKVPQGSWYAFATHYAVYHDDGFSFYLHPENPAGFGGEGGVRNFVWKLAGDMPQPLSGTYGGLVTIDNFPGVYIEETEIDFTFTPVGPRIDGSEGTVIRRRAEDAYTIKDVPIGRYNLTATYQGKPLKFRRWNTDEEFRETYDLQFKSQLVAQCDNCAKLEYHWEP